MRTLLLFCALSTVLSCELDLNCMDCSFGGCFFLEFGDGGTICLKKAESLEGLALFLSPFNSEMCSWFDDMAPPPPTTESPLTGLPPPPVKEITRFEDKKLYSHSSSKFRAPPPVKEITRFVGNNSPPPPPPQEITRLVENKLYSPPPPPPPARFLGNKSPPPPQEITRFVGNKLYSPRPPPAKDIIRFVGNIPPPTKDIIRFVGNKLYSTQPPHPPARLVESKSPQSNKLRAPPVKEITRSVGNKLYSSTPPPPPPTKEVIGNKLYSPPNKEMTRFVGNKSTPPSPPRENIQTLVWLWVLIYFTIWMVWFFRRRKHVPLIEDEYDHLP